MFCSCLTMKKYEYVACNEIPQEAINIAIIDHNKGLKRQKDANIVAVGIYVRCTSKRMFDLSMKEWKSGENVDKFQVEDLYENLGYVPDDYWIPTEYIEKDGILYMWHNPYVALTEDVIEALIKNDMVFYPREEGGLTTGGTTIHYIFKKSNYNIYTKKIIQGY